MIQELERDLLFRVGFFRQKPHGKAYLIKIEEKSHRGQKQSLLSIQKQKGTYGVYLHILSPVKNPTFLSLCFYVPGCLNNLPLLNILLEVRERPLPHVVKTAAASPCPLNTVVLKCTLLSIGHPGETSSFVAATNSIMSMGGYKQARQDPPQAEYPR